MLFAASLLAIVSFAGALIFTPLARNVFLKLGIVDHPTGGRKIHTTAIPRVGGIAIAAAISLSLSVTALLGAWDPFVQNPAIQFLIRLLPAAAVMFIVGLLDDLLTLKPWQKLAGEIVAAYAAYSAGLHVLSVGGYDIPNWLAMPLTIGWLLLCTNAFNLIDGVDGLAAGAGLFSTLTILLVGILQKNSGLVLAAVPLGAALLGFLRYNFNPATAFLGDSGSLLVGFLLGCYGIVWSNKTTTILGMVAPLMAMCVPLLDMTLSIARRFLRGRPIFGADRGHVHHRLLDRGFTPRGVALLLYGACAFGAVLSLAQSLWHNQYAGYVALVFCAGAWIGIRHLGYVEFHTLRKMLWGGALQRMVDQNVQAREFENSLEHCASFEEWWEQLCAHCKNMGFAAAELKSGGRVYSETFGLPVRNCWNASIPLGEGASLHLSVPVDSAHTAPAIASLVGIFSKKNHSKIHAIRYGTPRVVAFSGH